MKILKMGISCEVAFKIALPPHFLQVKYYFWSILFKLMQVNGYAAYK